MIFAVVRRIRVMLVCLLVSTVGLAATAMATVGLTASLGTVPLTGVVGNAYSGSFQCSNSGTEPVNNVTCSVAGLPSWASVGACSRSNPVAFLPVAPPGLAGIVDTIRCPVTGTPNGTGLFTISVTASGDGAINVSTESVRIFSVPTALDVSLGLPPALVGQAYSSSFACTTIGTIAPTSWACGATGLPTWITKTCFSISSLIFCILGGTPTAPGTSLATLTSSADNAATVSTTASLRVTARACDLDVTGQGLVNPATDGLLLLRRLLGLSGQSLVDGLALSLNYSAAELQVFVDTRTYKGLESQPTALVSGRLLLRLMQSVTDDQLLGGATLPPTAMLATAAAIRADVNAQCGTNF